MDMMMMMMEHAVRADLQDRERGVVWEETIIFMPKCGSTLRVAF